jgi:glutamate transport system permease protein
MSNVLFDLPGPRAAARQRIYGVLGALVALTILGWVVWRLWDYGELEAELWEELFQPNIWRAYWQGIVATVSVAAVAIVMSVAFGFLMAVARLSDHAWVRWPAVAVVEFFRAVPLLLLILFVYIAYTDYLNQFWALAVALMLYNGSVLAEVFRAGINAVPRGQAEASYAIGMRKNQVMRLVLIPQAVTIMLPAIISQCVIVLKDTALGLIIAYRELVAEANGIAQFVNYNIVPLLIAALMFITINYGLSRLAVYVERQMSRRGRSSAKKPAVDDAGVDQSIGRIGPGA